MVNQQIIHRATARLAADDLARLRENLLEQRLFRREQLRQLAGPFASRSDEGRQETAGQAEVHVRLAASARMVLADVEAALARMDDGTYGACHLCGRGIDRDRLAIVPQARYCGRCQRVGRAAS
ncbi:TraR/DksA family transcriptional regulator [Streptomyces sp. NPDC050418]|uniref:TraR/DksA family transcriptional regulator n=1 Tax=Streptomyces sp. NPDC050418 TaxID=3365612 RepID=UPI0037B3826A